MILPMYPLVIGEIPKALFDEIPTSNFSVFEREVGIPTIEPHPAAVEIGSIVASLAGISFNAEKDNWSYHSDIVYPGGSLRSNKWHQDTNVYLVTNQNPTEFLITQTFLDDDDIVGRSDEDLRNKGMYIWQPEPYQIVFKPQATIHRCPTNQSDKPHRRTLFAYIPRR